jgi:hypothetical protein
MRAHRVVLGAQSFQNQVRRRGLEIFCLTPVEVDKARTRARQSGGLGIDFGDEDIGVPATFHPDKKLQYYATRFKYPSGATVISNLC